MTTNAQTSHMKAKKQHSGSSKLSVSTPDFGGTMRRRSIISDPSSLLSMDERKKRNCEAVDFSVTTPDAEPRKRIKGPDAQFMPIAEIYKRSRFSPAVPVPTPSRETVRRKRKELGHNQEDSTRLRTNFPDSSVTSTPDQEGNTRRKRPRLVDVDNGIGSITVASLTGSHPNENFDHVYETQGSEFRACTPVSEILGKDADCVPKTPPLTAKSIKSQKRLFHGSSDRYQREPDGAAGEEKEEERRGWAIDRRRKKYFDHGKFTEDELISLHGGLNKLMEARRWDRDEGVTILTHNNGRGRPHAEARGAWEEIAKNLPASSIVRVNMKTRAMLYKGKIGRWDAEETELLKRLVQEHDKDWITIASKLGRSNGACARKWSVLRLDQARTRKKGKWRQEEYDELCHHVREAKATMILNPSRKAGNRKVKDNLRWKPIAFKMGRPTNQCGAVWSVCSRAQIDRYGRLAPSMDKEICLSEEDREWDDEDDRRLLKKMLRLISVDGGISWAKVFLRNRKRASCKARYKQMTHPRCLGDHSEATVKEQLQILLRRYAPDLIAEEYCRKLETCRRKIEAEGASASASRTGTPRAHQLRHGDGDEQETEESTRKVKRWNTFPVRDLGRKGKRNEFSKEEEVGDLSVSKKSSMNQARKRESGELPVRRNFSTEGNESRTQFRDQEPSESSCFRDQDLIKYVEKAGESREKRASVDRRPKRRSSDDEKEESRCPRKYLRKVEEGSTSKRHVVDQRATSMFKNRIGDRNFPTDVEVCRYYFTSGQDLDSLKCRRYDTECEGRMVEEKPTEERRKLVTTSSNTENHRRIGHQLLDEDEDEDSCSENEGSTSLEF